MLRKFRKEIGWPSDVALFDRDAMIVAQTSREAGFLHFNRVPGFRAPVLGTSLGRAYLAFLPEAEQAQIIETLAATPGQWTELARNPKKLSRMLQEIRQRGYALMDADYSRDEYEGTVWAMGVPIKNEKQVLASINIMMLRTAISQEDGIKRLPAATSANGRDARQTTHDQAEGEERCLAAPPPARGRVGEGVKCGAERLTPTRPLRDRPPPFRGR